MQCKTILVVEDEKEIRETLQQVLEIEGYQPTTAANGKEAMDLLSQAEKPCLILLDLMMPVMNGWEFLKVQKENVVLATIPVVVVSAVSDQARSSGAQAFLKKPVDLDVLLNVVKNYCG